MLKNDDDEVEVEDDDDEEDDDAEDDIFWGLSFFLSVVYPVVRARVLLLFLFLFFFFRRLCSVCVCLCDKTPTNLLALVYSRNTTTIAEIVVGFLELKLSV